MQDNLVNNSKEYSPKSITSYSNYFKNEAIQNNLNVSCNNNLSIQSHRIAESIKNIMNSNDNNCYNQNSLNNTEVENKLNLNNKISIQNNSNISNSKKFEIENNNKISFKSIDDKPIITGEVLVLKDDKKNDNNTNKNNISVNYSITASKNLLTNKKNQFSQKQIAISKIFF